MDIKTLTKVEYLVGELPQIDLSQLAAMILENFHGERFMDPDIGSIRGEDVRIHFTPEVQKLARLLCEHWQQAFDEKIQLTWQEQEGADPNTSFWAVVHGKNESTNVHDHASSENYEGGAKVSAAFYVCVPPDCGDLVFQYHKNPYIIEQELVTAKAGRFVMFDSTIPHFVTKNLSDENRIVISMNFAFVAEDEE